MLSDRFGWHPLDVEDIVSKRQRPKVDDYEDDGYLFIVLHFPVYDKAIQRLNAAELDVFIGPDYIVTLPTIELDRGTHLDLGGIDAGVDAIAEQQYLDALAAQSLDGNPQWYSVPVGLTLLERQHARDGRRQPGSGQALAPSFGLVQRQSIAGMASDSAFTKENMVSMQAGNARRDAAWRRGRPRSGARPGGGARTRRKKAATPSKRPARATSSRCSSKRTVCSGRRDLRHRTISSSAWTTSPKRSTAMWRPPTST